MKIFIPNSYQTRELIFFTTLYTMPCSICGIYGHNIRSCRRINPDFYPNPDPNSDPNRSQLGPFVGREHIQAIIDRRHRPVPAPVPVLNPVLNPALNQSSWRDIVFKNEFDCNMMICWITRDLKVRRKLFVRPNQTITSTGWANGTSIAAFDTRSHITPPVAPYFKTYLNRSIHFYCEHVTSDTTTITLSPQPIMVIHKFIQIYTPPPIVLRVESDSEWKKAAIKMDYLLKEMTKMGGTNDQVYPNIAPILDLHQDVTMPRISEVEKENAGVPSRLTNA